MRRLDSVWLLVNLFVAACVSGSQPTPTGLPEGPIATKSIELATLPSAAKDAQLRVVSVSPQGVTHGAVPLTVVFNKVLGELSRANVEPSLEIELTPQPPGALRWAGRHAVQFVPDGGSFPLAQRFEVMVRGSVAALDGSRLGQDQKFFFETEAARLQEASPHKSTPLERKAKVTLTFNQPVELDSVRDHLRLSVDGEAVRATVAWVPNGNEREVVVSATELLPLGAEVRIDIAPGLLSKAGPLPSKESYALTWTVRKKTQLHASCDDCRPNSSLALEANNVVRGKSLLEHLRILPAVRVSMPSYLRDEDYPTRYLYLYGDFVPRTTYRVAITPGLVDASGEPVTPGDIGTFRVQDYAPELRIGASSGPVLPGALRAVPLRSLNVKRYRVATAPLTPAQLPALVQGLDLDALLAYNGATETQLSTARENSYVDTAVGLPGAAPGALGTFALMANYDATRDTVGNAGGGRVSSFVTLQSTRLAMSAKVSRAGAWIWVTSLVDNLPVPDATVTVWGPAGRTYETRSDPEGLAYVPHSGLGATRKIREASFLVAQVGEDWTHKKLTSAIPGWQLGVNQYSDPARNLSPRSLEPVAMLYTDRGVYRPGDKAWVKGILRMPIDTGNAVVQGKKYTVRLEDPQGKTLRTQAITTNTFGTFAVQLTVPETARLGSFTVSLQEIEDWRARAYFTVAEYRPSEFTVSAEAKVAAVINGEPAPFGVRGDYLFGGPMGGAEATYTLSRNATYHNPPGADGYVTSDHAHWDPWEYVEPDHAEVATGTTPLDASGTLSLALAPKLEGMHGPERLRLDVSVTDVSRQALSASASVLVHPADFYVGLQLGADGFVTAPSTITPRVIGVTPAGGRIANRSVKVELSRRRYTWAKRNDGGSTHTEAAAVDEIVASCQVALQSKRPVGCPMPLQESGSYLLRATASDDKGRVVRASTSFYAVGAGRPGFRDDDSQATVELVTDRGTYREGDVAKVLVKSPFGRARALVTLERESILWHKTVELRGGAETVEVPVLEKLRPNAYVSVHLLNLESTAVPSESYRVGYAGIEVDSEQRRLNVDMSYAKRDFAPGETLDVTLRVARASGEATSAELAIYAVDEGVLSLSGYQAPDPLPFFTQARALEVSTLETRSAMARIFDFAGTLPGDKGEEGGGGGGDARANFKQTAYFNPSVITDANGVATVHIPLPDNLTTFRLMAVAVAQDDRYGTQSGQVRVNKPLMVRPALPRFLRVGDSLDAGVVLSNRTNVKQTVSLTAAVTGAQLRGPSARTVELPAQSSLESRFAYVADAVGDARFKFSAVAGKLADAVEVSRKVVRATQLESVAAYGATTGVEAQRLGALSEVRDDTGGVDVSLSTSALVGLDGAMQSLVDYPYLCTEQLSSRLFPLIPLKDLAAAYGFSRPRNADTLTQQWLARLLKRQTADGGFSMWERGESVPWVSAYALLVLSYARESGLALDESILANGIRYLRANLNNALSTQLPSSALSDERAADLVQSAFNLFVLAALGASDSDALERLFDYRGGMSPDALALLSLAGHASSLPTGQRTTLRKQLEASVTLSGNRGEVAYAPLKDGYRVFSSKSRTHALVLLALLLEDANHPMAAPLARGLVALRKGSSFESTQASAFALLALQAYYRAQEKQAVPMVARVYLDSQLLFEDSFSHHDTKAQNHHLSMTELARAATNSGGVLDLAFQGNGRTPLYYEARFTYARRAPPETPLDAGFFVETYYQRAQPSHHQHARSAAATNIHALDQRAAILGGDTVLVDVDVVNAATRRNVVIESPLPAGFEAIDPSLLSTSAGWLADAQNDGDTFSQRELRDDRALFFIDELPPGMHRYRFIARATSFGRFVLPPTLAMEMYQPEVFGRTAASVLTVGHPN